MSSHELLFYHHDSFLFDKKTRDLCVWTVVIVHNVEWWECFFGVVLFCFEAWKIIWKMEWSSEVTLEFLRLYEQESAIWNPKDPLHKNRTAVAEAWKRIEGSLSIKCSVKELKKKKESLMATFRPLLNKVKASMKTGNGADDVYKPNWFAFETMARFLHGIYQPRNTVNTQVCSIYCKCLTKQ